MNKGLSRFGCLPVLLLGACAAPAPRTDAPPPPPMALEAHAHHQHHARSDARAPAGTLEAHGIRFESLRLTGSGLLLDFRYRVTDPTAAARVVNREVRPYIIDPESGMQLQVPHAQKVGTLRHSGGKLQEGRVYPVLFANPGRRLTSGSKVTIVMGDYRLDDVTVE